MSTGPFACLAPVVVSCHLGRADSAECQFSEMFGGRAQRRGRFLSQGACSCGHGVSWVVHSRGLLLGFHLVLWAGLWVQKGEVGGIVRDVAGVGGE